MKTFNGKTKKVFFTAKVGDKWVVDAGRSRECRVCGGRVVRSWKTGILWRRCSICRRLVMIFGPNIKVTRLK